MHINPLKHRHTVAVPVFLVALAASTLLQQGSSPIAWTGTVRAIEAMEAKPFAFANGSHGILTDGTLVEAGEAAVVEGGSVLIASEGIVRVFVGSASIIGFRGAAHVAYDGRALTVSALTTPLLLSTPSNTSLFLPAGFQRRWQSEEAGIWREGPSQRLPLEFLEEQLSTLLEQDPVLPPRVEFPDCDAPPATLRWGDTEREACESELSRIAPLLLASALEPSQFAQLLPKVAENDVRTLAFLHPNLRVAAWTTLDLLGMSAQAQNLILASFVLADTRQEPAGDLAVDRWAAALREHVASAQDPAAALSQAIVDIGDGLAEIDRNGYPERHKRYAEILIALGQGSDAIPSAEAANVLASIQEHLEPAMSDVPPPEPAPVIAESLPAPVEEPKPVDPATAATMERQMRGLLQQYGALISTQMVIRAIDQSHVTVTGAVFADHAYDFTVDLAANMVRDIRKDDGEIQPYPMSIDAFMAWAGQ